MVHLTARLALLFCIASQASALYFNRPDESTSASVTSASSSVSASASTSTSTSAPIPQSTTVSPLGSATDVFIEGGACRASWIPDKSGATTWKNMTIDLMTGSNLQMTKLGTVTSNIDGTNPNLTSFNYTCPQVTPNSAIYFLQYSHDGGKDPTWTTRFAIADQAGNVTPPPNANQPQGGSPAIPWGEGALVLNNTPTATPSSTAQASLITKSASATNTMNAQQSLANKFSSMLSNDRSNSYQSINAASDVRSNFVQSTFVLSTVLLFVFAL
ncbi:uncharacterized protein FA14DRAFT_161635 [Meira miltonrushii]|uniref:Yeast cell wall synthesis Kre9/Knh1-like N-terminal domain-containing protein n=1 Tax=Meira miltonrushii TaxID=1280837 RepID=A0A316V939_9BASI|nr:uncharacterized protein FA14DRAFT_161635 [Meira miltonrushii]PWN34107.1 hypothetical protein FA14DRAFT_161635 [Meira miltonrushii]